MKYNVYIKEKDNTANWWYKVEEQQINQIASAYHSKSRNFLLPSRGKVDFGILENIAIFENTKDASDYDIEQILIASGDFVAGTKKKKFRNLSHFGIDFSNHFLDTGNFAGIKDWSLIHDSILTVSKRKFEDSHFADAVESAFKEINKIIKEEYKIKTGDTQDGDALMRKAFLVNNPIFRLADQSNR